MSQPLTIPREVRIAEWVKQVRADPVRYLERQVTEILLNAIGLTPTLTNSLVLKGGILMSLAHGSSRQTGDVDFTAIVEPLPYADALRGTLDQGLARAAAALGYVDIVCAVQRFEYKPRPQGFAEFRAPALKLSVGYARRGDPDEARLKNRQATRVLQIDVSFRERVVHATELVIDDPEVSIQAYTPEEVIGEKLRALLQQPIRNRSRRQDVYDIDWLVTRYQPGAAMQGRILETLLAKSEERDVVPVRGSLADPAVKARAQAEWETLRMEIGALLPEFEPTFARVIAFYEGLPWPEETG